ncbi:MAG: class I SAM-dependent methyltransferase [Candidatus Woesearchaeota archaeon]
MKRYNQTIKIKARNIVIKNAINALTSNRSKSTLARRSYLADIKKFIKNSNNSYEIKEILKLTEETIIKWENFYDSTIDNKQAKELKIAYLSGSNPENDLKVFCEHGVLPENIWAFESDNSTYLEAIQSALISNFPFIKIIDSGIDKFLKVSPQKFDIIYLDFCGPLPTKSKKQKTLQTITNILDNHSLNSLGILITNVSLPTKEQDQKTRDLISKLVSLYLYPKDFLENSEQEDHNMKDGPIAYGYSPNNWLKKVETNLENYYGQFITRLLIDHSNFISSYNRFSKHKEVFNRFFNIKNKQQMENKINNLFHFTSECKGGDVICESGQYSLLWTIASLSKKINQKDVNYPQSIYTDCDFEKFAELFLQQLNVNSNSKELINNLSQISILLSENKNIEFLSEPMQNFKKNHSWKNYYQFCDLFLFHQILEILFRQITTPYHVNIEKTMRWTYTAKSTTMFMDMFVLDEARYLYDWMPTIDMFQKGINDIERQLSFRLVLDGISKHCRWYNNEFFSGTAIIDQFEDSFEAKILKPRIKLN